MFLKNDNLQHVLITNVESSGIAAKWNINAQALVENFEMPAEMKTVEEQLEDILREMIPYLDSNSNSYDFAFGMNWKGVINDERVTNYK